MSECIPSRPCGDVDNCPGCMTDAAVGLPVEQAGPADVRLPDDFWSARPAFKHIRQAAWSSCAHPDAVLGAFLARYSASIWPNVRFDSGTGNDGSLNLFVALVAESGIGKSTAMSTAARVASVPVPAYALGSGEGLIEAYMGLVEDPVIDPATGGVVKKRNGDPKTELVKKQVSGNAFFSTDEGQSLNTLLTRVGSTLGATLRSAWMGGDLGQANAKVETTRRLESGTYSLGLLVGYQPGTAAELLADVGPGTPQRFLWFGAQDRHMPMEYIEWPGPIDVPRPTGRIAMSPAIRRELRERIVRKHWGTVEVHELDSHQELQWCKVSSLLCAMDGRTVVADEDWTLAKLLVSTSAAYRAALVERITEERGKQRREQAAEKGMADVARKTAARDVVRVAERIHRKACEDGWFSWPTWRKNAARDKPWCNDALEYALSTGLVVREGSIVRPAVTDSDSPGQGGTGGTGGTSGGRENGSR